MTKVIVTDLFLIIGRSMMIRVIVIDHLLDRWEDYDDEGDFD